MVETVDFGQVVGMLRTATGKILAAQDHLGKLDAAVGDGDHGVAMARTAGAVNQVLDKEATTDLKVLLGDIGWAVMSAAGGSTSTLYGAFFMGMADGVPDGAALDCAGVAAMLEAATAKLRMNTKAEKGNKTLIDALVPAVDAIREAADAGKDIAEALDLGAAAAAAGSEATKEMIATFGRARNLGERVLGHVDPGSASMSIFFAGLREGIQDA